MLKNTKDVQNEGGSFGARLNLRECIPANDNIAALSDELLGELEEPVNDNEDVIDHRSLGVAIPSTYLQGEGVDREVPSYSQITDEAAELDFSTDRLGTRGFLSE